MMGFFYADLISHLPNRFTWAVSIATAKAKKVIERSAVSQRSRRVEMSTSTTLSDRKRPNHLG
ncbi:MAG: hypothetical protein EAZ68_13585, partial [Oscillatoriales cyanobacterium]